MKIERLRLRLEELEEERNSQNMPQSIDVLRQAMIRALNFANGFSVVVI